jgi:putative FmdB family regulatory protein
MPLYNFGCDCCGDLFYVQRTVDDRNNPLECEKCSQPASRVITAPHFRQTSLSYKAAAINERSQHEPRLSGHQCRSGCGCKTPGKAVKLTAGKTARFQTGKPNSRPWMLGH